MSLDRATVCIIGAGAAGLTLAQALVTRCHRVILLEGGGLRPHEELEDTFRTVSVGIPHRGAHEGRFRAWGGSTTRWGGQLWPWEPYEFDSRPELEIDGWPIPFEAVSAYYGPALSLLGIRPSIFSPEAMGLKPLVRVAWDAETFHTKYSVWLPWSRRNLGRTVGRGLRSRSNLFVSLNTTAIEVLTNEEGSRAVGVRVRSPDGSERIVDAEVVVVAAGAIESNRLLLNSRRSVSAATEWLGRGFMDHLSVRVGRFQPRNRREFSRLFAPRFIRGIQYTPRIVTTQLRQTRDRTLGAFGHWEWVLPSDSGLVLLRHLLRSIQSGRLTDLPRVGFRSLIRGARDAVGVTMTLLTDRRRYVPADAEIFLRVDTEQKPDRESRLYLSDAPDQFGLPRVIIDWRISDAERWTVKRTASLLREELARLELGKLELSPDPFHDSTPWEASDRADSFHMMGGTRMAARPEEGVVDTNLRVFGVENLFVASTSVFPTGGMANPTLTLLALSLRLAEYLSTHFSPES